MNGISKDTQAMMIFESQRKSALVAYILWFFLGGIAAHRFYLGRIASAVAFLVLLFASILLLFSGVGFIGLLIIGLWIIVDAFLIPGIVSKYNQMLSQRIISNA